jgi:hypothetical protein
LRKSALKKRPRITAMHELQLRHYKWNKEGHRYK